MRNEHFWQRRSAYSNDTLRVFADAFEDCEQEGKGTWLDHLVAVRYSPSVLQPDVRFGENIAMADLFLGSRAARGVQPWLATNR